MSAQPSWRKAAHLATVQRELVAAQTRSRVICTLRLSGLPLSINGIATLSGISYDRARRALETLIAMRVVIVSGPKNNLRFQLADACRAMGAGGPASDQSAAEGSAGISLASAARPGRAA